MAQYLPVIARFDETGQIFPLSFIWPDGRTFAIDRVLDVRRAASRKQGGCGIPYLCRVRNRKILLFLDENKWFFEPVPE